MQSGQFFSIVRKLLFRAGRLESSEMSLVKSVAKEYLNNIYHKIGVSEDNLYLCLPLPSSKTSIDGKELILGTKFKPRLGQELDQEQVEGACSLAEALISYMVSEAIEERGLWDREEEDGYYQRYYGKEYEFPRVAKLFDLIVSKSALCQVFLALSSATGEDDGELFADILSPDWSKNLPRFKNNPRLSITVYNSFGRQNWLKGEFPVGADVKFELSSGHYSTYLHAFGRKFFLSFDPFEISVRRMVVSRARKIL